MGGEGGVSTWTDWTEKLGVRRVGVQKGSSCCGNPVALLPLLFHQHPPLSSWPQTFLTSELTWLLALAKAGCIYCVVIFLTFCDFMLDTRGFF